MKNVHESSIGKCRDELCLEIEKEISIYLTNKYIFYTLNDYIMTTLTVSKTNYVDVINQIKWKLNKENAFVISIESEDVNFMESQKSSLDKIWAHEDSLYTLDDIKK